MIKVAIPITGQQEYKALKKIIFSGKFLAAKRLKFLKRFCKIYWYKICNMYE